MNGLLVVVVALALPKLELGPKAMAWTAWGFIYIAWSFTVFYWVGNASSNRALSIGDNPLGQSDGLSAIGFLPGVPSVVLVVVLLAIGARGVLSGRRE